jgi:hypothetical protein
LQESYVGDSSCLYRPLMKRYRPHFPNTPKNRF